MMMSFLTLANLGGNIMDNSIQMVNHGVKCDTKDCDFTVQFTEFEQYEGYVNKPCPKCGANLLTEEDYEIVSTFHRLSNDEEYAKEFNEQYALPQLPKEIADMIAQLEDPEAKAHVRIEFVDGVPKMTSEDPKIQEIIDAVEAYLQVQKDIVGHLNSLNQNE